MSKERFIQSLSIQYHRLNIFILTAIIFSYHCEFLSIFQIDRSFMQPGPENLSPAERSQRSPLSARVLEAEYVRARHENMQASLEKPRARKPRPVTVSRNAKTDGYPYDPHSGRNSGSESPNPGRTAFRQILHRTESVREVVATRSPKERYGIPYSACAPGTTRLRRGYRGRQAHEPVDRTADHIGPNRRPHRSDPAA